MESGRLLLGGGLLAIPAVYVYVTRNYPAELSDAKLKELKDDEDVLTIGRYEDEDRPEVNLQEIEASKPIPRRLSRSQRTTLG